MAFDGGTGLSPLADLTLSTSSSGGTVLVRKLVLSSTATPRRNSGSLSPRMKMKLTARGSLMRRLNSAPSPTVLALESAEKENAFVVDRSPGKTKAVLEDQDVNSQDSACLADPVDISFLSPTIPSRRRVNSWGSRDSESPQSSKRSYSLTSPHSLRSVSFCSTSSFDDGFSELTDLENVDENNSGVLGKLLTGQLIGGKENSEDVSTPTSRPSLRRAFSMVENKLNENNRGFDNKLAFKRPRELSTAIVKRRKSGPLSDIPRHKLQRSVSETATSVLSTTLSNVYGRPDLIADFSRPYVLPVVKGQHLDLTSISHDTLAGLFRGDYHNVVRSFTIIDCRYPYEFEAGHIRGAINLYNQELVEETLLSGSLPPPTGDLGDADGRNILIFHCEFSVLRGPTLYRWLRREDRNTNCYPSLQHPEIYLLNGGYSAFHTAHQSLCEPAGYRAMLDPHYTAELNKYTDAWGGISGSRTSLKRLAKF